MSPATSLQAERTATLELYFDDNLAFENRVLRKKYRLAGMRNGMDELVAIVSAELPGIKWKEGQDVTREIDVDGKSR